jgi:hypothetical protein
MFLGCAGMSRSESGAVTWIVSIYYLAVKEVRVGVFGGTCGIWMGCGRGSLVVGGSVVEIY